MRTGIAESISRETGLEWLLILTIARDGFVTRPVFPSADGSSYFSHLPIVIHSPISRYLRAKETATGLKIESNKVPEHILQATPRICPKEHYIRELSITK